MKVFRPLRLILLALLLSVIPVSSYAGVFISVSFAPPILPVYEQPPCPDEGLMWVPGYWAYGEDGYYWIPGTWVPAPYEGALWTPPYWGWENGFYLFHPGYWGRHVGYYGGVNYGFGYMGVGFVGGMWRGHDFEYNRAVMRVDDRRIHHTYEDRTIVDRYTIRNDRRVAFSGGRDGIHHDPRPEERFADRDQHVRETSFQQSHENAARSDRSLYVKNNGGHPSSGAVQRPFGAGGGGPQGGQQFNRNASPGFQNQGGGGNQGRNTYTPPNENNGGNRQFDNPRNNKNGNPGGGFNGNPRANNPQQPEYRNVNPPSNNNGRQGGFNGNPRNDNPQPDNRNFNNPRGNQGNPQPQHPQPEVRQMPQPQPQPQHPQPEVRQMPQQPQPEHRQPEFRQMPQQREAPPEPRPQPQMQQRPQPQEQPRGNPQPQQQHGGDQHGGDRHGGHDDRQH